MNQPYARVNQPYATLTLASALREMFRVQLYKNNARALLSRILSILNLDWLQHARSVRGVYEWMLIWNQIMHTAWARYYLLLSTKLYEWTSIFQTFCSIFIMRRWGPRVGKRNKQTTYTLSTLKYGVNNVAKFAVSACRFCAHTLSSAFIIAQQLVAMQDVQF